MCHHSHSDLALEVFMFTRRAEVLGVVKSFVGQAAAFEREPGNVHDGFAVAIKHVLLLFCSFFYLCSFITYFFCSADVLITKLGL